MDNIKPRSAQRPLTASHLINQNDITEKIIGCCLEVHQRLGPGLLESIYENALCIELQHKKINYERQKGFSVNYRERFIGDFRMDLIVEGQVVVELKCVQRFDPVFEAQILSYMKLGNYKLGLLINFNSKMLRDGIKRYIL